MVFDEWSGWSRLSELCFTQGKQVGHCSLSQYVLGGKVVGKDRLVGAVYLVVWLDG